MTEAHEPEVRKVSSGKEWKEKQAEKPLEVPSGNVALVRRIPLPTLYKAGKIPNSLMPIVHDAIKKGEGSEKVENWSDEQLMDLIQLMDIVLVECVIDPAVFLEPKEGEDRDPNKLYVDEVDFADKAFVYQYAIGGVDDLESFREEQESNVDTISNGKDLEDKTEQSTGN